MTCSLTKALLVLSTCSMIYFLAGSATTQHAIFADGGASEVPRELRPIEIGLPDDAIVALVDFRFENTKYDESKWVTEAKCNGNVTRFISGSDANRRLEFDCVSGGIWQPSFLIKPDTVLDELPFGNMKDATEAKDCLVVYRRRQDGSIQILRIDARGMELAPAYEWLENTKDRIEDRAPLAVMALMDKTAAQEVRYLAYRIVAFSHMSLESRFEIIKKAIDLAASPDDVVYGVFVLDRLAFSAGVAKEDNITLVRYFLQGLTTSKDVRDVNMWLRTLAHVVQKMNLVDYPDLSHEIADAVRRLEVAPASPELQNDMARYAKLKARILERVDQKQPAHEENPAPPASDAPAPPPDTGNP